MKSNKPTKSKTPTKAKTPRKKPLRQLPPHAPAPSAPANLLELIAARAYEHYERRIHKGPLDDWLQAEKEILDEIQTWNADRPHRSGYSSGEQG